MLVRALLVLPGTATAAHCPRAHGRKPAGPLSTLTSPPRCDCLCMMRRFSSVMMLSSTLTGKPFV